MYVLCIFTYGFYHSEILIYFSNYGRLLYIFSKVGNTPKMKEEKIYFRVYFLRLTLIKVGRESPRNISLKSVFVYYRSGAGDAHAIILYSERCDLWAPKRMYMCVITYPHVFAFWCLSFLLTNPLPVPFLLQSTQKSLRCKFCIFSYLYTVYLFEEAAWGKRPECEMSGQNWIYECAELIRLFLPQASMHTYTICLQLYNFLISPWKS